MHARFARSVLLCLTLFAFSCGSVAQKSNSDGGPDASGSGGTSGTGGVSGTGGISGGGGSGGGGISGTGGASDGGGMTDAGGAAGGSSGSTHLHGGVVTVASDVVKTSTVRLVEHGISRAGKSCGMVQGNNVCVIGGIKP